MCDLPPSASEDFVAQLARDVKTVRAGYVDELVSVATTRFAEDGPEDDNLRAKYLREFMRYAAADFEVALFRRMAKGPVGEDRVNAARFYLYGAAEGFWQPQPETLRLARNLCPDVAAQPAGFNLPGAFRIAVRAQAPMLREVFIDAIGNPETPERDRLLAIENVLQGAIAGLWDVPDVWKGATNG